MYLRGLTHLRGINSAIYLASGKLSVFGLFCLLIFLHRSTNISVFFATLVLCEALRTSLSLLMPWGIQYFVDALNAVSKIEVGIFYIIPNVLLLTGSCHEYYTSL